MNAGTLRCFANPRRHSRICRTRADSVLAESRDAGALRISGADIHSKCAAKTSHAAQLSHFGVSPKCRQICLCLHTSPSANRRIAW
jgi:hypothetical protein